MSPLWSHVVSDDDDDDDESLLRASVPLDPDSWSVPQDPTGRLGGSSVLTQYPEDQGWRNQCGTLQDYHVVHALTTETNVMQSLLSMVDRACGDHHEQMQLMQRLGVAKRETGTAAGATWREDEEDAGDPVVTQNWSMCQDGPQDDGRLAGREDSPNCLVVQTGMADAGEYPETLAALSQSTRSDAVGAGAEELAAREDDGLPVMAMSGPPASEQLGQETSRESSPEDPAIDATKQASEDPLVLTDHDMDHCLLPCSPSSLLDHIVAADPSEAKKPPASCNEYGTIVETFEMILEEPAAKTKRNKFWPFRRVRLSRRNRKRLDRNLNVVASESHVITADEDDEGQMEDTEITTMEPVSVETTDQSSAKSDMKEDEVRSDPPLQPVSGELMLYASDETEEEEKKEDEMDITSYPPPAAGRYSRKVQKEARYKQLLSGLMNNRLAPVKEEESPAKEAEAPIRVPGLENPDKFLSSDDFIGDEFASLERSSMHRIIEEVSSSDDSDTEFDNKESDEPGTFSFVDYVSKQFYSSANAVAKESSVLSKRDAHRPAKSTKSKPLKSWVLSCQNQNVAEAVLHEDETSAQTFLGPEGTTATPSTSATVTNAVSSGQTKPVWKAAKCPSTGRTYWYHRETRETTWVQPAVEDIAMPKPKTSARKKSLEQSSASKSKNVASSDIHESEELAANHGISDQLKIKAVNEEIKAIMNNMSKTENQRSRNSLSLDEGEEEQILQQLVDIADSMPFDERAGNQTDQASKLYRDKPPLVPKMQPPSLESSEALVLSSSIPMSRVPTHMSAYSHFTESTVQIKNTYNPDRAKRSGIETGSISSARQMSLNQHCPENFSAKGVPASPAFVEKVPSNVPVARSRELVVEEFKSSGCKAEVYDVKTKSSRPFRQARLTKPRTLSPVISLSDGTLTPVNYLGDTEDGETRGTSSPNSDSLSALSEMDYSSDDDGYVPSLRRALDEAIAKEDWQLATKLLDKLRVDSPLLVRRVSKKEWAQTELDRFIADNDWDAVTNYIARVRNGRVGHMPPRESNDPPRKRSGAFSQLQLSSDEGLSRASSESDSLSSYYSDDFSASQESASSVNSKSLRRPRSSRSEKKAATLRL